MRPVFRAVFGKGRSLLRVERLAHGSKKGAYRLTMDDGGLEALLEKDPAAAERPLSVIAGWLTAMAAVRSPSPGKVAFVDTAAVRP
jgi:hypothetical protein